MQNKITPRIKTFKIACFTRNFFVFYIFASINSLSIFLLEKRDTPDS